MNELIKKWEDAEMSLEEFSWEITKLIAEKERLEQENLYRKSLMQGWSSYAWRNGEYIDDVQGFFDEEEEKIKTREILL